MTDYTNLLERLAVSAGDQECLHADAKAAIEALQSRVAYLESRLEISPEHDIDGIAARDATIKLQDGRIAELEANRADLAKQALVAWDSGEEWEPLAFCLCAEENGLDSCHELIWEGYPPEPWGERWQKYEREAKRMIDLVSQYAAPPVITQHEPVTTVEDRHNADGKSCHITDDLPAGMPLYAAPPVAEQGCVTVTTDESGRAVAVTRQDDEHRILSVIWEAPVTAPVRLTDRDKDGLAVPYSGMGGIEDYRAYAQDIETAVLRANGFKVEGEQ